jgi:O-antigen ligase
MIDSDEMTPVSDHPGDAIDRGPTTGDDESPEAGDASQRPDGSSDAVEARRAVSPVAWWMVLATAFAIPLLYDSTVWFAPGPRPLLAGGTLALKALVAQLLVGIGCAAWGVDVLRGARQVRWARVMWVAAALAAWIGVSTVASPTPGTALIGFHTSWDGALAQLTALGFFVLVVQVADTPWRVRRVVEWATASGGIVALYGVVQIFGFDIIEQQVGWGSWRSFATIGNPDMFGGFVLLVAFSAFGLALSAIMPWQRAVWSSVTVVAFLGVFTSTSRAAWLASIVGIVLMAVVASRMRSARSHTLWIVPLAAVVAIAATGVYLANRPVGGAIDVGRIAASAADAGDKNGVARIEGWKTSLVAVSRRPITGSGPGTFFLAFEPVLTEGWVRAVDPDVLTDSAHNVVLDVSVQLGVIGALLFVALLVWVALGSARTILVRDERGARTRLMLAGVWVGCAALVADLMLTPFTIPMSIALFGALGCLVAPLATDSDDGSPALRRAAAVAVLVLAVIVAASVIPRASADGAARVAMNKTLPHETRLAAAQRAVAANPLDAEYRVIAAKVYADEMLRVIQSGKGKPEVVQALYDSSVAKASEAVDLQPDSTERRIFLASLQFLGGEYLQGTYYPEAELSITDAKALSDNSARVDYWHAKIVAAQQRTEEALGILDGVLKLRPGYSEAAVEAAEARATLGDMAGARRVLETALKTTPSKKVDDALRRLQSLETSGAK